MRRHCTVTQMPARRVHEIVCRCWPELHSGRFVTAGSLAQPDRRGSVDVATPAEHSPELDHGDSHAPRAYGNAHRAVPFADRRVLRRARMIRIDDPRIGPFDDA
jgi:hypothetical protein